MQKIVYNTYEHLTAIIYNNFNQTFSLFILKHCSVQLPLRVHIYSFIVPRSSKKLLSTF